MWVDSPICLIRYACVRFRPWLIDNCPWLTPTINQLKVGCGLLFVGPYLSVINYVDKRWSLIRSSSPEKSFPVRWPLTLDPFLAGFPFVVTNPTLTTTNERNGTGKLPRRDLLTIIAYKRTNLLSPPEEHTYSTHYSRGVGMNTAITLKSPPLTRSPPYGQILGNNFPRQFIQQIMNCYLSIETVLGLVSKGWVAVRWESRK